MLSTASISTIRGNDRGTAFIDAVIGSLWWVSARGKVTMLASSDVVDVRLGEAHGVVLTSGGSVLTFSIPGRYDGTLEKWEKRGQFGLGTLSPPDEQGLVLHQTPLSGIAAIAATSYSTLAVDRTGVVWGAGSNEHGELGMAGPGSYEPVRSFQVTVENVRSIAAGDTYIVLTMTDGELAFAGGDSQGNSGLRDYYPRMTGPVRLGVTGVEVFTAPGRTYAVRQDGSVLYTGMASKRGRGGHAPATYHCPPTLEWREAPGLFVSKMACGLWGEAMALDPLGNLLLCGDTQKRKFDVWMHERYHFFTETTTALDVALTPNASFLLTEDGWASCHPDDPHAGLSVRDFGENSYRNGYTRMLHPSDWTHVTAFENMGLTSTEAAKAVASLV